MYILEQLLSVWNWLTSEKLGYRFFAWLQWRIAVKQRNDQLWDKRYKLYAELIEFVQGFEPECVKYRRDGGCSLDQEIEFVHFIGTGMSWINEASLELRKQQLIFKSECLFDNKMQEFLNEFLTKKNLEEAILQHFRSCCTSEGLEFCADSRNNTFKYMFESDHNSLSSITVLCSEMPKWHPSAVFNNQNNI